MNNLISYYNSNLSASVILSVAIISSSGILTNNYTNYISASAGKNICIFNGSNENNLGALIAIPTEKKIKNEYMMNEYLKKRAKIVSDSSLDSKSKGRLIHKLTKRYFPDRNIAQEETFYKDLLFLEKMRPEV
jgi:hypothetical protein